MPKKIKCPQCSKYALELYPIVITNMQNEQFKLNWCYSCIKKALKAANEISVKLTK